MTGFTCGTCLELDRLLDPPHPRSGAILVRPRFAEIRALRYLMQP